MESAYDYHLINVPDQPDHEMKFLSFKLLLSSLER